MSFVCNICSFTVADVAIEDLDRETGLCPECGSNVRLRALALLAGKALFGTLAAVAKWPTKKNIVAYGISDWPTFAKCFAPKISYTNTQFDREQFPDQPLLDITAPRADWIETADLIICSEVLEHVAPPVQQAFNGLAALLKRGGALIFSVPYSFKETVEHFPELYDWRLEQDDGSERVLVNTTRGGTTQRFSNLCFHGGGSEVLEMRIFGLPSLEQHMREAGFCEIELMDYDVLENGIHFKGSWGRPMVVRKA